jgi:hypothetical protein
LWFKCFIKLEDPVRKKPPAQGDGISVLVILKDKANEEGLTEEQVTRLVQVGTSKKFSKYNFGSNFGARNIFCCDVNASLEFPLNLATTMASKNAVEPQ